MPSSHDRALDALLHRGRLRTLAPRIGIDFTSNDYLGLAQSDALRQAAEAALARGVPVGAGGSRLLRGNHDEHELLEHEAAAFFGAGTALFMGGGFAANTAIFSTLPQRGDAIFYDTLIHASTHDGMRLSRANSFAFAHNDPQSLEDALRVWREGGATGTAWIAVESLYSMDGDKAPLADIAQAARRYDAMLVIDEAHATGVLGPDGRGLGFGLEGQPDVISLHTCGKALGASGALILSAKSIRDFLINRARPFIYATAPSPLIAAIVRAALSICRDEPERRQNLAQRVAFAQKRLMEKTLFAGSGSHIQPLIVGADTRAVELAKAMQSRGFDIRAIRPPTVPEGSARLRMTITLNTTEEQIADFVTALCEVQADAAA